MMVKFIFTDLKSHDEKQIDVGKGEILFVFGANGSGKSSLIQYFFSQHAQSAKRISAHRQTWFATNTLDLTARQRKDTERSLRSHDKQLSARWRDNYSSQRLSAAIFDLVNAENIRSREIAHTVDSGAIETALKTPPGMDIPEIVKSAIKIRKTEAPLRILNDILEIANLSIEIFIENDEQLLAQKHGGAPYSIVELSDGERNAILIGAEVLTASSGSIIIIDEPERHLHRSIISPLLSSLFQKRQDLIFVISTHDVNLPLDNKEARTLLVRSCEWSGQNVVGWDTDLFNADKDIDENLKEAVLGSRRKVLFIEGKGHSLDKQIYEILFPKISVFEKGTSTDVIRATQGIKSTSSLTWVEAYGLIDADDRTLEDRKNLQQQGIFALDCYSVESLYYHPEIISRLATTQSQVIGTDKNKLKTAAEGSALEIFSEHKDRLCAQRVERRVRHRVLQYLPNYKDILNNNYFAFPEDVQETLKEELEKEQAKFEDLVNSKNLESLISRYPIKNTPIPKEIAKKLEFRSKSNYQMAVRQLIMKDSAAQNSIKHLLGELKHVLIVDAKI